MSFLTDLRYRLEYFALRIVIGFFRALPLDKSAEVSAALWRFFAPRGRRHAKALANLDIAFPDMPREEKERIAMSMWDNMGRVMVEMMQIDRILEQPERIAVEDDFFIRRYKGKMGPVIAVSLHMGNWELAMWPLALSDCQPAAVYRLVKNPYVDAYLRTMRKRLYPGGLFAKGRIGGRAAGFDTARLLGNFARQGGRLAFLADLYDGKGIEVPFFGRQAKSAPFPAMLARRAGSRLWVGRCLRDGRRSRFRVTVKELKVPRTSDTDADIVSITSAIQKQFEDWIRETPEQWMWTNRRFS
ncbi:MAG: lysophospholipid acyltransferase family protein [Pseudomonadota bacterium]|nr:lysophospholipid acyltransferase family protein [Pseudomonadota bacterium]